MQDVPEGHMICDSSTQATNLFQAVQNMLVGFGAKMPEELVVELLTVGPIMIYV